MPSNSNHEAKAAASKAGKDIHRKRKSRHTSDKYGCATFALHGEDAVFVDEHCLVVVDGVGGTLSSSALFAREVCASIANFLRLQRQCSGIYAILEPRMLLLQALHMALSVARRQWRHHPHSVAAAVTACLTDRRTRMLHVLTVGDTKAMVVRKGQLVFESTSVVRSFNHPAYLCSHKSHSFEKHAFYESFALEPNDIILTCSDGVHDNLYMNEIIEAVQHGSKRPGSTPNQVAGAVVALAQERAQEDGASRAFPSPFALLAAMELRTKLEADACVRPTQRLELLLAECTEIGVQRRPLMKDAIITPASSTTQRGYSIEKLIYIATAGIGKLDDITVAVSIV